MTTPYLDLDEPDYPILRDRPPKPVCTGNCGEVHTCAACKTEYCNLCREYVHAKCQKGEKP